MNKLWFAFITLLAATPALRADVNVLILGSDSSGDRFYEQSLTQGQKTGTPPFLIEEVATHLRGILEGADPGTVNVTTRNIAAGNIDWPNLSNAFQSSLLYSSNLLSWFYWPYGDFKGGNYFEVTGTEAPRWADLRGEAGTPWDYVILLEDPSTIERMPGFYTLGVAKIAEEVAKGSGQTVLLMPWPAPGSNSSLNHYKEVVYRTGRSVGIPVAPAGLAWQAAGAPMGASHPTSDGAYIAAATLYSRLFGHSASSSSYTFNDTVADTVHATVQANQGAPQYSGRFAFAHPTRMLGDKRRHILHSNRGTSTENRFRRAFTDALVENKSTHGYTLDTYNSDTPNDDGLGWPYSGNQLPIALNWGRHHSFSGDGPSKSYFTNPDFWQLGFGFAYQSTSDSVTARGLMAARDFYVGYLMGEGTVRPTIPQTNPVERADEIATARLIPVHVLYSQIQREFPGNTFMSDQSHLSRAIDVAAANYMGTLYSGRTFIPDVTLGDDNLPDPVIKRHAQWVGYETAWMVGTLQARAPALKILPASGNTSVASEQFSLRFLNPPQADVTVRISVSDDTLAEVSHETVVFTPQNHSQPVTISSRAKNRNNASNPTYEVRFATTSDDEVYDGLTDSWSFNLPANATPSVDITAPAEGANFPVGTDLTVSVNSVDPDGSVAHVTLWVNDILVRQDNNAPYRWSPADGDAMLANPGDDVYELRIRSVDAQGAAHTVTRTITVGTPELTPPAAPTGLTVSPAFGLVTLDWADSIEGDFLSYSVYRSTTPGSYGSPLATALISSDYIDTQVENDTTYYYVVTAVDRFFNESALSAEKEATPGVSADATLFGSERDGYGGFTTSVLGDGESWTLLPTLVRYINDDSDGPGGAEGGTKNGTLLNPFVLDRSEGSAYRIQGVVHLTDGYADDNNRVGIYLFGDTANPSRSSAVSGDLHLLINLDTNFLDITAGINGTSLASTAKLGSLQRDALFGTDLVFTAEIAFTGSNLNITFSLTDQNFDISTVSTTVSAAQYPGNYFGFATRARTRGTVGKTNPWTMDYKNFGITDTGVPAAPEGLTAHAGDGFVVLDWEDSDSTNLSSYRVHRSTTSGQYDAPPLANNLTTSRFIDSTVEDGLTYFYAVTAVNSSGLESALSTEVSLTYFPNTEPPVVSAGPDQTATLQAGVPWDPGLLNPAGWYDASDAATITGRGGSVSQWADKSGNGLHLGQATSVQRPQAGLSTINGINAIDFDGMDDTLSTASNPFGATVQNAFVIAVHRTDSITAEGTLFSLTGSSDDANRWQSHAPSSGGTIFFDTGGTGAGNRISTAYGVSEGDNVLAGFYGSTTDGVQQIFKNGALLIGDASGHSVGTVGNIFVGSSGQPPYQKTAIGELIIINGTVGDEDRQKLEGYLAHKWGLPASLPAGHSYKSIAPGGSGASVNLNGAVSDPDGGTPQTTWTKISGPGTVIFGNASAVATTASFNEPGIYLLRLTADDGAFQSFDELVITIMEHGGFVNGGIDSDGDGVLDFFEHLYGSDPNDAADSGFRIIAEPGETGDEVVFRWEVLEGFTLGTHYEVYIAAELRNWELLPVEHYTLQQAADAGRTQLELTLTHDYGDRAFIKLAQP